MYGLKETKKIIKEYFENDDIKNKTIDDLCGKLDISVDKFIALEKDSKSTFSELFGKTKTKLIAIIQERMLNNEINANVGKIMLARFDYEVEEAEKESMNFEDWLING